eukprot:gene11105-biopygen3835
MWDSSDGTSPPTQVCCLSQFPSPIIPMRIPRSIKSLSLSVRVGSPRNGRQSDGSGQQSPPKRQLFQQVNAAVSIISVPFKAL